jgi:signal transduction histidine kinase
MPYAKKIIEEHGGKIAVDSKPGEGTRVLITLPAEKGSK